MDPIYLDYNSTTPLANEVLEVLVHSGMVIKNNQHQVYSFILEQLRKFGQIQVPTTKPVSKQNN